MNTNVNTNVMLTEPTERKPVQQKLNRNGARLVALRCMALQILEGDIDTETTEIAEAILYQVEDAQKALGELAELLIK